MSKFIFPATPFATAAKLAAQSSISDPVQEFLSESYEFRRNTVSGKIEFRVRASNNVCSLPAQQVAAPEAQQPFRPFNLEDLNSVLLAIGEALPGEKRLRERVTTIVNSRRTPDFNPAVGYFDALPAWDSKNHVGKFIDRLPGITTKQRYWLHLWLQGMVAQALQLNALHGNELVLTLIGDQGCGKSTFCRILLPPELREYYLDHVNLANKFDKEMALTNNYVVNVDELEQVKRSQQAELKQLITKYRANGRPIYGRSQVDRPRVASFVATTNNRHPLHDPTGSRRFLCVEIPSGAIIDYESPVDYQQLYAQLLHELRHGERYWLTDEEAREMQRHNARYQSTLDLERIVDDCFRRPAPDEPCQPLTMSVIIDIISRNYTFIQPNHSTKSQLGKVLMATGFEQRRDTFGVSYFVVQR